MQTVPPTMDPEVEAEAEELYDQMFGNADPTVKDDVHKAQLKAT